MIGSFVGRERELADLGRLTEAERMVTVAGPGGCGKTTLVARCVTRMTGARAVCVVDLGDLQTPGEIPFAVLRALALTENAAEPPLRTVAQCLSTRPTTLVLEGCEHVARPIAVAATELLSAVAGLRILATSRRAPLGVAGEVVYELGGLGLPADPHRPAAELMASDAVLLLVQRAAQADTGFVLDATNAAAVARICQALDGSPLAIELAASRLRAMSVAELEAALWDKRGVLSRSRWVGSPRHGSLEASLSWSYALLDERQRLLLRRLAVFRGGFDIAAAQAVCCDDRLAATGLADTVADLVDCSLVAVDRRGSARRLHLPEAVRHFSAAKLEQADEQRSVAARHADYFSTLIDELRHAEGRARLLAERANIRAALSWDLEHDPPRALAIVPRVSFWWSQQQAISEARSACAQALHTAGPAASAELRAPALIARGTLALVAVDMPAVTAAVPVALAAATEAQVPRTLGYAHVLAAWGLRHDAPRDAVDHGRLGVELVRRHAGEHALAWGLSALAAAQVALGHVGEAAAASHEALTLAARTEHPTIIAWATWVHARALAGAGELTLARRHLYAVHERERGSTYGTLSLGYALDIEARLGRAAAVHQQALLAHERPTPPVSRAALRLALAMIALGRDRPHEAERWTPSAGADGLVHLSSGADEVRAAAAFARQDSAAMGRLADELSGPATPAVASRQVSTQALTLGRAALLRGELADAGRWLHGALRGQLELGLRIDAQDTIDAIAILLAARHDWARASRALGTVDRDRERCEAVRLPPNPAWLSPLQAAIVDAIGPEATAMTRSEGRRQTPADVLAAFQAAHGELTAGGSPFGLTDLEQQIVGLVGDGLTNDAIAAALFISRGTVKAHLSRIFRKTGVSNRVELVARTGC